MLLNLSYDILCSFYIADQDTAQYNNIIIYVQQGKIVEVEQNF